MVRRSRWNGDVPEGVGNGLKCVSRSGSVWIGYLPDWDGRVRPNEWVALGVGLLPPLGALPDFPLLALALFFFAAMVPS
jgi:hypothetical protein